MMVIVPFLPCHLQELKVHESQAWIGEIMKQEIYGEVLFHGGPAYSGIVNGEVIICAGLLNLTETRAQAWALLSPFSAKYMRQITKAVSSFLSGQSVKRIETPVKTDFKEGHRWAKMLGFEREGTMRAYGDDGLDYDLYARVK